MLDVYDHEMDLQDRYEDEQLNPLFDTKVVNYKTKNSMGRDDYMEERVKRAVKKYGKTLWHYTDINALCGIIGKKEIWFGSAEHMNDREELIGFINDLEKEVYACIDSANKEKANDVFGQIKDRLQKEYPYISVSYTHLDVYKRQLYNGKPWYYVKTTVKGVAYTGFCSSAYLKR